jgi:hypothetical protein
MTQAYFEGDVRTLWLVEEAVGDDEADRRMQLLEDFAFVDPNGQRWLAPAGRTIDGASIPRMLWSIAGDPFIGPYRRASVLHDVACDDRTQPSKIVHRMFYDAMIADGASAAQAVEFYAAVRLFGPDWDDPMPAPAVAKRTRAGAKKGSKARAPVRRSKPRLRRQRVLGIDKVEEALDQVLGK